jgi:hypothetical protein
MAPVAPCGGISKAPVLWPEIIYKKGALRKVKILMSSPQRGAFKIYEEVL